MVAGHITCHGSFDQLLRIPSATDIEWIVVAKPGKARPANIGFRTHCYARLEPLFRHTRSVPLTKEDWKWISRHEEEVATTAIALRDATNQKEKKVLPLERMQEVAARHLNRMRHVLQSQRFSAAGGSALLSCPYAWPGILIPCFLRSLVLESTDLHKLLRTLNIVLLPSQTQEIFENCDFKRE